MTRRSYKTAYHQRKRQREHRDANRRAGRCINDTATGTHGAPTHGVRCDACDATHRRTR
jgi:hypothetical protein